MYLFLGFLEEKLLSSGPCSWRSGELGMPDSPSPSAHDALKHIHPFRDFPFLSCLGLGLFWGLPPTLLAVGFRQL